MNCAQLFYLPALLIFPPQLNVIHATLNLVYQFSLHTEYIGKFGPLEHIFNTPSHHRIHHARNPYCIDKNYGGILIIWDKLFGTFAEEKKTEKLAYGLVHNVNTFNQFHLQVGSHYTLHYCYYLTNVRVRFKVAIFHFVPITKINLCYNQPNFISFDPGLFSIHVLRQWCLLYHIICSISFSFYCYINFCEKLF